MLWKGSLEIDVPKTLIYHVCRNVEWNAAVAQGVYIGSSQDQTDGFIHFSTHAQVRKSTAKHRAGQGDLKMLVVDALKLGAALRWEPSRDGDLFPHLYNELKTEHVLETHDIHVGSDGQHIFPNF